MEIYLAGGCFWGMEHLMNSLKGVSAISGYANGRDSTLASYKRICEGDTGFKECVRVIYDESIISLEFILHAYFYVVHPEQKNRQGNDIGEQYQAGVYYTDLKSKEICEGIFKLERERYKKFYVELEPLKCFYEAEEYHQHYLDKNPNGYCHIPFERINTIKSLQIDPANYKRPSTSELKKSLTNLEYEVTQESKTEAPFNNEYWAEKRMGIYVDITTGEPLFSSIDKYNSSCGWPSFKAPINPSLVIPLLDTSHGMVREEVRSRSGNAHLGHVFHNDIESPNGTRYCINSASLRFIPYEDMEREGYGYLLSLFK